MKRAVRAALMVGSGLLPGFLFAQGPAVITAWDIQRSVEALTADSVGIRATPSRGLEVAARYVAVRFAEAGLEPAGSLTATVPFFGRGLSLARPSLGLGDSLQLAGWFQRYQVPLPFDFARSAVIFTVDSQQATADFTTAARIAHVPFLGEALPPRPAMGAGVILVAGHHTAQSLQKAKLDHKIMLYVPPRSLATLDLNAQWEELNRRVNLLTSPAAAVVVLSDEDSASFARRLQAQRAHVIHRANTDRWIVLVRPDAVEGMSAVLAAAGMDLKRLQADTTPVVRDLPALRIRLDAQVDTVLSDTVTAPNVVGVLPGGDSALKNEYVIVTAHLDDTRLADRAATGAADNSAGVAALVALAQAFGHAGARPRRSIVFAAISGGAQPGFWGSEALAEGMTGANSRFDGAPLIPLAIDVNLDLSSGTDGASVLIDGLESVELAVPLDRLAAASPDLRLTVVDGGSPFLPRADHFAFTTNAALGLPSLNVRTERQDNHPQRSGPATVDAEQVARLARLVFQGVQMIANADRPPQWSAKGRQQMTEGAAP